MGGNQDNNGRSGGSDDEISRRTRLDRDARRSQIIEAAASVFTGRDPSTVTFDEIATAAGVSRALVYNYFGDRRGLLEAIHARLHADLFEKVEEKMRTTRGRRNVVEAVVGVHFDMAFNDAAAYRAAIGLQLVPHDPELAESLIRRIGTLWGGNERADMVATGALNAMHAMVLRAVESGWDRDDSVATITSVVWSALQSIDELGLPLTPWWEPPAK
ncbi:MAG: TetR/AcrR family transcriptional regulator [Acidimicrobiia bacterium]